MKKLILIPLLAIFIGCDKNYIGCGPIMVKNAPEPQYDINYIDGGVVRIPNGKYYYSVIISGNDNKNHKVYCSYDTWLYGQKGEIICVE